MWVEKALPDIVKALPIIAVHFDKGGQVDKNADFLILIRGP
jgi:hypothetical protein